MKLPCVTKKHFPNRTRDTSVQTIWTSKHILWWNELVDLNFLPTMNFLLKYNVC